MDLAIMLMDDDGGPNSMQYIVFALIMLQVDADYNSKSEGSATSRKMLRQLVEGVINESIRGMLKETIILAFMSREKDPIEVLWILRQLRSDRSFGDHPAEAEPWEGSWDELMEWISSFEDC